MAIDLEGWDVVSEEPVNKPRPAILDNNRSILQSNVDLSGWAETEEESRIYYLEDKDKIVAVPSALDDQQAYELTQ
jgi:hypothetical protein